MVFKKINYEKNEKIKLILIGCVSLILMQATIHIGVNIRLLPTTGMTLPFLSYGGSSIVSISILSGMILNLTKRKINQLKMKKKILISTGGSGGHVIPATTIYDHLKNNFEVIISTDLRGLNYLDVEKHKIFEIDTPKLNKSILLPYRILKVFFLTLKSLLLFKKQKIEILISTGGYMSLPLCFAAKIFGIKIFLLEPNMVIGRANKFFLNFCEKIICYSNNIIKFPNKYKNKIVISNPLIRNKYYKKNSKENIDKVFTLMIVGGSQGAKIFDEIIHEINCKNF